MLPNEAPLVFLEPPGMIFRAVDAPVRLRENFTPNDIAPVEEDGLARDQLPQPAKELGRERLGAVDRARRRDERKHGLEVRGSQSRHCVQKIRRKAYGHNPAAADPGLAVRKEDPREPDGLQSPLHFGTGGGVPPGVRDRWLLPGGKTAFSTTAALGRCGSNFLLPHREPTSANVVIPPRERYRR